MRCSLKEILQRVDLRGYEAATEQRCPVCSTESVLSIRGSQSIACRKCAFVGDIIHLYAAAKRIELAVAVSELKYHGFVDFNDDFEQSLYLSESIEQATLRGVWARGRETFAAGTSPQRSILGDHLSWYTQAVAVKASAHFGVLQRSHFEEAGVDFPKEAKETLLWWKKYAAIAIPVYASWKILGFWLIRTHQADDEGPTPNEMYLPVITTAGEGVAFAHAVAIGTPEVFVVDSAVTAMKYNMRQLFDGDLETPFLVPSARHRIDLTCIGESQPIFFTAILEPEWFFRATEIGSAKIVFYTSYADLGFQPQSSLTRKHAGPAVSRSIVAYLRNRARPAHEAYAQFLLSKKPSEARRIFAAYPLNPVGQSRCHQAISGEDSTSLARIFERGVHTRLVEIDGKSVVEREDGWYCGDALVTDATFQIAEIVVDGETTLARGHVQFRKLHIPFECPYDLVRRNTWKWLEDVVIAQPGPGMPSLGPGWAAKLLRIAVGLHEPRRVTRGASYGWSDEGRALVMPYFVIRADGILGTEHAMAEGPRIARPAPLTAEEWGIVQDHQACQVLLALLGNLLRTQAMVPGYGIALRSAPHVVNSVAKALLMPIVQDPRPDRVERAAMAPLPMPVIWTDDALADVFASGVPMHVLMSVDPSSHRLLKLHKNWLCLETTDFSWNDSIRLIFLMLRDLLWVQSPQQIRLESEHLFTDIAARLHLSLAARGIAGDVFSDAARELGKSVNHQGNAGFSILLHLQWAQEQGRLTPVLRDGIWVFKVAEIRSALANPLTPKSDLEALARQLVQARYLVLNRGGEWGVVKEVWDLSASVYANK